MEEKVSSGLFHIQYFKFQFVKFVINKGDTNIRERANLCVVTVERDGRS